MTDSASVARVRAALLAAGHPDNIVEFPEGTRTAAEAAAAIGCSVAQIAKSIVFRSGDTPVVVIASGANRVDAKKLATLLGVAIKRADADWVRAATGFAIGGVAPLGHTPHDQTPHDQTPHDQTGPVRLVLDQDLLALSPIWAAAGSPTHVFRSEAADLARITGAVVGDVRQDAI